MKTLTDIKQDMSDLYEAVKKGDRGLKEASEMANIAGKFLKAEQLDLARAIFLRHCHADAGDLSMQGLASTVLSLPVVQKTRRAT